jgi:hypothetical protein
MLQTLQNELVTHLQPLSLDTASTITPPPGTQAKAAPTLARPAKRVETRPSVGSSHQQEIPDEVAPLTPLLLRLRALTGLEHVKNEIESLANWIRFQQKRAQWQLPTSSLNLHMVFTGNPGTGKTTVARLVGEILKAMGILTTGHLVETDRAGLVAEYAGQTAPKTNRLIDTALNGILFIDEAYGLLTRSDDAYGHEAIQTLVKRMEDDRHRLVVILAGYEEPMRQLLRSNPGLSSRFNRFLTFSDYLPDELLEIFLHFCEQNQFQVPPSVRARLICGLTMYYEQRDEHFGNGRLVRNVFENAIRRLANRLARDPNVSHESLTTFQCDDITFGSLQESAVAARLDTLRLISPCPACGKKVRQRVTTLGVTLPCPHCGKPHCLPWGTVNWSTAPSGR